jgi:copper ion binding protein
MGLFGRSKTIELDVEGMTCNHCVMRVKKALESVKGVKDADVDLGRKKAKVKLDPDKVEDQALVSAVEEAGYKAKVSE